MMMHELATEVFEDDSEREKKYVVDMRNNICSASWAKKVKELNYRDDEKKHSIEFKVDEFRSLDEPVEFR